MFKILELYGIPIQIIDAILLLYTDASATILTPDGESDSLPIKVVTLAFFLFIIVVDYVLRMSVDTVNDKGFQILPRRSSRNPSVYLTDTDYQ